MHNSLNDDILWYIDDIEYLNNDIFQLKGWILHKENEITALKIGENNIIYNIVDRPDVKLHYPNIYNSMVGIEFSFKKEDIKKPISVILNETIISNIGNLEYWFVFYSKFNKENKELIIVDDFYKDPDMVRNYAINNLNFESSGYHKGQRTNESFILDGTKEIFEEILGKPIYNWNHPNYANGRFQFCTSQDAIVYHTDTQNYAAMVYLTPNAPLDTGTSTYKSKITGATKIHTNEGQLYEDTFKGISDKLNFYDKTTYDVVDSIANVYNRLVMFNSKSIHAATSYFGDTINNSRFFHIFFFDI
jgi:hypothetical protein